MGASGEQSIRSARLAGDTLARPTSTQLTDTPCSDRRAQPRDLQLLVLEAGRARGEAGLAGGGHEHDRADPAQRSAVLLRLNEPPGVWVRDQTKTTYRLLGGLVSVICDAACTRTARDSTSAGCFCCVLLLPRHDDRGVRVRQDDGRASSLGGAGGVAGSAAGHLRAALRCAVRGAARGAAGESIEHNGRPFN
eukprot:COSAG01_NODE_7487_length_3189_cov_201.714239_6_plen_193_part_00